MYSHETSPAPVWSESVCLDCASVLSIVLAAQTWAIPMESIMMSKEPGKVSNNPTIQPMKGIRRIRAHQFDAGPILNIVCSIKIYGNSLICPTRS